jgi:hypothetical protein
MKQADLTDMFEKAAKSVRTLVVVVSPDPLSPTVSSASAMKTPENREEDPDDPKPTDEDIQMKYYSGCTAQV